MCLSHSCFICACACVRSGWAANTIKFSLRVLIAKAKTQQLNFATPIGKRITATIQDFVDFIVTRNTKLKAIADGQHH